MQYKITTVHGTGGRRSEWPNPDSLLGRSLASGLRGDVRVSPFRWRGSNTFSCRTAAAGEFGRELARTINESPDAKHFVIAHSHGGNVVLDAIARSGLGGRVAGVVCVATPFLVVRGRVLGRWGYAVLFVTVGLIGAALFGAALVNPFIRLSGIDPRGFVEPLLGVAMVGAGVLAVALWARWSLRQVERYSRSGPPGVPILVVRLAGDEASAFLAAAQFLSWLVGKPWAIMCELVGTVHGPLSGLPGRVWDGVRHGRVGGVAGVAVWVGLSALLVKTFGGDYELVLSLTPGTLPQLVLLGLAMFWVAFLPIVLSFLVFAPMAAALVAMLAWWPLVSAAFDWRLALASPLLEVLIDSVPAGRASSVCVLGSGGEVGRLTHTLVMHNPEVHGEIVRWIEEVARGRTGEAVSRLRLQQA